MKYYFADEALEKIKCSSDLPPWLVNYLAISKQIKAIRIFLGMSQAQLAEAIGTKQSAIARLEQGNTAPNIKMLKKISAFFNADLHIMLIPKQKLSKTLEKKAESKAKEIVAITAGSSALEDQTPAKKAKQKQLDKIKRNILENNRHILWGQNEH